MDNQQLKDAGLKITLPRLKVLHILEESPGKHFSAEDIYKKLLESGEDVGLATVYRVLTQFESAGFIAKHNFEGGVAVYELKKEVHHDHMVCVQCAGVEEFIDEVIESRQKIIAQNSDFQMTDHVLTIYGICATCQKL